MQVSIILLLLLPAALRAVPCTDTAGSSVKRAHSTQSPPETTTENPTETTTENPTETTTENPTETTTENPTETTTENPATETTPYVPPPLKFPKGTFALPKPSVGCPKGTPWKSFLRYWDTEDNCNGNEWPSVEHFAGYMKKDGMQMFFCVKVDGTKGQNYDWPEGDYCIVKKGDCPAGFDSGSIYWDDENSSNKNLATKNTAIRVDGTFNKDTEIEFCCRNDGPASNPIKLPTRRAFYLLRYQGECQEVAEMTVTEEVVQWDDEDISNQDASSGAHPLDSGDGANHKLSFCYYEPIAA